MSVDLIVAIWLAALGLVVGSYLNVVIHRLPIGRSTVIEPSACPACGARIRWHDNIPVIGYLLLRGRCRSCAATISPRYPVVEALVSALFVGAWYAFGPTPRAITAGAFLAVLVALAGIDREHFLLPDVITLPTLVAGLVLAAWRPEWGFVADWRDAATGALVGAAIPLMLTGIWLLVRGEEGMGLGDVKMLAAVGAVLGLTGVVVTLFLASLIGSAVGIAGLAIGRLGGRSRLPFGVFLALGAAIALFVGSAMAEWYVSLL